MFWDRISELLFGYWLIKDDYHEEEPKEKNTDSFDDPYKNDEPIDPNIDEENRFEKRYKYTFGKKNG